MSIIKVIKKAIKYPKLHKGNVSFAQEGEDILIDEIFFCKKNGFYVDIGAHHPVRFSNTKLFYDNGWSGINIDLINHDKFNKYRPRDKNIECLVGNEDDKEYDFYIFKEGALNTSCPEIAQKYQEKGHKLIEKKKIKFKSLKNILDESNATKIDFMSIDVEGAEMEVLNSNDWEKYRPTVILAEIHKNIEEIQDDEVYKFLKDKGYKLTCKTKRTGVFELT